MPGREGNKRGYTRLIGYFVMRAHNVVVSVENFPARFRDKSVLRQR